MENPIKMDDLGGKPTIYGNNHLDVALGISRQIVRTSWCDVFVPPRKAMEDAIEAQLPVACLLLFFTLPCVSFVNHYTPEI